ncbi:hypothetical protein ARMGADRAFT_1065347 [Armillaria gallica]|uniref:Uncharacterized protein n=1 Tax=Armillaria gallica TaxID=47427 RepID=A0A2H3DDU1_ARMGA|nr:hypothetical protein ARMGADRAFT_1065347 [Armillaria gallica]
MWAASISLLELNTRVIHESIEISSSLVSDIHLTQRPVYVTDAVLSPWREIVNRRVRQPCNVHEMCYVLHRNVARTTRVRLDSFQELQCWTWSAQLAKSVSPPLSLPPPPPPPPLSPTTTTTATATTAAPILYRSHKSRGSGPMHCEARLAATAQLLRGRYRPLFAPPDVGVAGLGHGGGGPKVFLKEDILVLLG